MPASSVSPPITGMIPITPLRNVTRIQQVPNKHAYSPRLSALVPVFVFSSSQTNSSGEPTGGHENLYSLAPSCIVGKKEQFLVIQLTTSSFQRPDQSSFKLASRQPCVHFWLPLWLFYLWFMVLLSTNESTNVKRWTQQMQPSPQIAPRPSRKPLTSHGTATTHTPFRMMSFTVSHDARLLALYSITNLTCKQSPTTSPILGRLLSVDRRHICD